ncbi:hypothetical protein PG997_015279 [Apiospora hydei]|uniref:Uncharacterized protein n=1 Tax=Apiospora hydei TaxID=1337664 RepID=A0ABR1UQ69_9PEZI
MGQEERADNLPEVEKNEEVPSMDQEDGGFRPRTRKIPGGKFRPNDKVLLRTAESRSPLGPYLISSMVSPQKYRLLTEDGRTLVNDGQLYDEASLSFA